MHHGDNFQKITLKPITLQHSTNLPSLQTVTSTPTQNTLNKGKDLKLRVKEILETYCFLATKTKGLTTNTPRASNTAQGLEITSNPLSSNEAKKWRHGSIKINPQESQCCIQNAI